MNLKSLRKHAGAFLRLRPVPKHYGPGGNLLGPSDGLWRLQVVDGPVRLRLENVTTGHSVELQPDNVHEYRSPEFLFLKCQLHLDSGGVRIEPFLMRSKPVSIARYQIQIQKVTEQWIPDEPVICEGCTAAVQYRPMVRISLSEFNGEPAVSQCFCPKCARLRGVRATQDSGFNEDVLYADENPSYRWHLLRLLRVILPSLPQHAALQKLGVTGVGAVHSPNEIELIPSFGTISKKGSRLRIRDMERSGLRRQDALIEHFAATLTAKTTLK